MNYHPSTLLDNGVKSLFLQGSRSEQNLVQDLINEQLKIFGVEVTYIPRKMVRKQTILEEVQSSKFDDNFLLEAYLNNFDGYGGAGDIMTKFGVSVRDEVSLTISKERFEDFISPFLEDENDLEVELASRPREGDLIYFPLGQRLFEVKFVEHENPFYQLGKITFMKFNVNSLNMRMRLLILLLMKLIRELKIWATLSSCSCSLPEQMHL